MTASIHDVLDELRAAALDERDKGDKFERLVQAYLRTDPEWAARFSDVWLWSEWPGRGGRPDTGIDLVAANRDAADFKRSRYDVSADWQEEFAKDVAAMANSGGGLVVLGVEENSQTSQAARIRPGRADERRRLPHLSAGRVRTHLPASDGNRIRQPGRRGRNLRGRDLGPALDRRAAPDLPAGLPDYTGTSVYPGWPDVVEDYRNRRRTLGELHGFVVSSADQMLTAAAHAEAERQFLELPDSIFHQADPRARELYLDPLWTPIRDELLAQPILPTLSEIAELDARLDGVGQTAVLGLWATLGVNFRDSDDGSLYLDVREPTR